MTRPEAARRLIITSDDFGADLAVNQAVDQAHRQGVLTAASLMVGAPAMADAVDRARSLPGLGVGLHVVLVDGAPVLPPERLPALVKADGTFRDDMAAAGARMFFDPSARRQLAAEIEAQFTAFAATGLVLDHVNAHKHFHLHPTIGGLILKLGRRYGARAVRAPFEPAAVIHAIEPNAPTSWPLAVMAKSMARRFGRAGWRVPDQVFGLAWSGALTTDRLRGLIARLPPGLSEIYLHPAAADAYPGSAPGYRYRAELAALCAPEVARAIADGDIVRGSFAAFSADH